jgi:hypothetical protein
MVKQERRPIRRNFLTWTKVDNKFNLYLHFICLRSEDCGSVYRGSPSCFVSTPLHPTNASTQQVCLFQRATAVPTPQVITDDANIQFYLGLTSDRRELDPMSPLSPAW